MRRRDQSLARDIGTALDAFDRSVPLLGIRMATRRIAFIEQLLESIRRVSYVAVLRSRPVSARRADPNDELFDPVKAAIFHMGRGDREEAFWMVFLFVHFGRNSRSGWRYAREIYGRCGGTDRWDWSSTSSDPVGFRAWLRAHEGDVRGAGRGFGNHRRYQSLDAYSPTGTGAAVATYVDWVGPSASHTTMLQEVCARRQGDPRAAFDDLYRSMSAVVSFGRLARFDYLTMVGKLELAPIVPGSTYLQGATGPKKGAKLLFANDADADIAVAELDQRLKRLDSQLHLEFGMQVLEDSVCNWQKSPDEFKPFRG